MTTLPPSSNGPSARPDGDPFAWFAHSFRAVQDNVETVIRGKAEVVHLALVCLLAERFKVTQAVGQYKAEAGLPPADPGREEAQIARLRGLAEQAQLDPEFSEKFLRFIIDEVIRHHERAQTL